jgi:hypothetical protein
MRHITVSLHGLYRQLVQVEGRHGEQEHTLGMLVYQGF